MNTASKPQSNPVVYQLRPIDTSGKARHYFNGYPNKAAAVKAAREDAQSRPDGWMCEVYAHHLHHGFMQTPDYRLVATLAKR